MKKKVKRYNSGDLIQSMIDTAPGETREQKVQNLKKEAETKNRLANPEANVIERMDSQGNPAKKTAAKPAERKPLATQETRVKASGGARGAAMGSTDLELEGKMGKGRNTNFKSGGKVAGKLATRGYGCVKK